MLKLHSLDIAGFKTFVDPVEAKFAGGITAIVGPNGCGKSNLTDAISWVLGEQSAKSLRGSKMQDVIFSGSEKRKPVGMAEVTLTLSTDPSFERAVDGFIQISRRVFREGGSQYRLNGKVVRLKEIKDLLMDTGLGIRAYSVIEQGKIGMILSGKPQERRKLLEEAAGITRYKERKRIAEIKLEEALGNLMRLDDIVSEVDRALRSLKRQASAARRYQQKEREYQDLLKQVLLGRWSRLRSRLEGLESDLTAHTDRDAELAARLSRDEATLAEGRRELDELARILGELHQKQADLAATIEGRQEFLKGSKQRSSEIGERLDKGRSQADERRRQTADYQLSLGNLDDRTQSLVNERDDAAKLVAEDEARITEAQRQVQEASARLEALRKEILGAVARVNESRTAVQRQQVEIERRSYRLRFLGEEDARLQGQLSEARSTVGAIDAKVQKAQDELDTKAERQKELNSLLESLLRREAELSDERRHLESNLASLRQRQRILVELSEEHEERRRSLTEKLAQIGIDQPEFLADVATPAEGWEDSIDHFLGSLTEAVVLSPEQDALALSQALSELNVSGIFLSPPTSGEASNDEVEDEALAYSLAEALDLPEDIAAALPPAYLVQSADDAARLAAQYPGVAFISRERLWAQGGALRVQGAKSTPGVLARSSELETIREEIPRDEAALQRTVETLKTLVQERTRSASEKNRLEERIGELRRDIAVAQARRQDAAGRLQKFEGQYQKIDEERQEIETALAGLRGDKETLERTLEEAEKAHQEYNAGFDRAQAEVEAAKESREGLRTAGAGNRGRLELLEERLESHNQEAVRVRRQITYSEEQLQLWSGEDQTLQRRLEELGVAVDRAEVELAQALEQRGAAQERVLAQQQKLDNKRDSLRGLEESVQTVREERERQRSHIETLRIDQASVGQDAEHLSASYREAFRKALPGTLKLEAEAAETEAEAQDTDEAQNIAEDGAQVEVQVVAEAAQAAAKNAASAESTEGADEDDPEAASADGEIEGEGDEADEPLVEDDVEIPELSTAELAEMEAELARCKAVLERLGPVNVLAAEEYDEQQERHGFLTTQRRDVAESVESLKVTILEINDASSQRFRETFDQVNATFGKTFARLFRGGDAEMRLFDEDDLLETGIEIIARPPGKRPQNIMLLSGGEKALTAIALLFALFETKPSPFCILDEVDAPLDDVNVLRFVETLQQMAQDTQFLVVTHNKLTMEVATTLYGVTMEERGISKLVGVQMDGIQPRQEAGVAV